MTTKATEKSMSRSFSLALRKGKVQIRNKNVVNWVSELVAHNGVADFVLTPTALSGERLKWAMQIASCISTPAAAKIVASLKVSEYTGVEEIVESTGLSRRTVDTTFRRLVMDGGIAKGSSHKGFKLQKAIRVSDIELWAYELKLRDWKHGMYQALQYKAFAHSVAIVLPKEAISNVMRRLDSFKLYNVGVLIFDAKTGKLNVLVPPRKSNPSSLAHYLFALSVFVRRVSTKRLYSSTERSPIIRSKVKR